MAARNKTQVPTMTHDEQQQRAFFNRTPLSFLGMTFAKAMSVPSIRIAITCGAKVMQGSKGKSAPVKQTLI